ncbi:MAG: antirestriction protein ArdA [Bacteroides sp.]|nr:antirestriction protein ArdA [Bacteroides sp.]
MKLQFGELNITSRVENRLNDLGYSVADLEKAIADHKSSCNGKPALYVGTYAKYNNGSIRGLWIDLSSFNSFDDFITFCKAIHADEADPELMAQDFEGFPRQWYNEGFIYEEDFDKILEYSEMCDKYGKDAVDDYMEFYDSLDKFEEAYCGEWDSEEDFARNIIEECYNLEKMMGELAIYFDYEAFGHELFLWDYSIGANGHVFRRV